MMLGNKLVATMAILLTPVPALAQSCAANDAVCALPDLITDSLSKADRSGLTDAAIGDFCQAAERSAKGAAAIVKVRTEVVNDLKNKLDSGYAQTATYSNFNTAKNFVESGVTLAMQQELAGIVTGMKAVFEAYPRTKAEFCATLAPETVIAQTPVPPTVPGSQ